MISSNPTDLAGTEHPMAGLTSAQVAERVDSGRTNRVDADTTRSVGAIVRHNVITRFNILLGSMAALMIAVGSPRDALFGLILIANTMVGVTQELRAKRTLDRLALLDASTARVQRNGTEHEIDVADVVVDDLILVQRGDQIVADGTVISSQGLEVDEALLTGESDPLRRNTTDHVRSGSVVISGSGSYVADCVGNDAYANQLGAQARKYQPARSEIGRGLDQILRLVTWILVPTAALLIVSQVRASETLPAAIAGSVAGVVSMVPEGLVLLTSMAMAISVVRLGRRAVLTRELQAIEGLARVDIVCVDKTGTLTEGAIQLGEIVLLGDMSEPDVRRVLGALGAADPNPNPSLAAIAAACPPPGWTVSTTIPFSSERKWSAADFGANGVWLLGAPDVLLQDPLVHEGARCHLETGHRVLVLASAPEGLAQGDLVPVLTAVGLLIMSERIKDDASETLAYFAKQNVAVKVISGDHPVTVAAVAAAVGLGGSEPVDAGQYLGNPGQLVDLALDATVIGRVSPEQKQIIVNGLQAKGHTVAMTGDGVNDLLALKEARVGIAMGSGSAATRSVAQFVLLDNGFSGLPGVVAEGRRVIGNIERVGKLFLSKTIYAFALSLAVGVAQLPFPLLPRHLSLIAAVNIGIPSFFLALAPNRERATTGFVDRIVGFAVPAGLVAAVATFVAYADIFVDGATLAQSRTTATVVLFAIGTGVLVIAARPMNRARLALVSVMTTLFVGALLLPPARRFYDLELPPLISWVETVVIAAISLAVLPRVIEHLDLTAFAQRLTNRFRRAEAGPLAETPLTSTD